MRAVREQPRLAAARIIGVICLVVAGIAIGKSLDGGDTDRMHATQLRLVSAQRLLAGGRSQLRTANDRAARAHAEAQRAGARARALARSNRRIAARADAEARRARARARALARSNRRIAARADAEAQRAGARVRALARSNRRMRDELAAVKRARRQTKSKPPT